MDYSKHLKKFTKNNWKFILSTYLVYLLIFSQIDVPLFSETILISAGFSIIPTLTNILIYKALIHYKRNDSKYKILSFILNISVLLTILGYILFVNQGWEAPKNNICEISVEEQCELGKEKISVPHVCILDDSIQKNKIPYNLEEAPKINNTKIICS